MQMHETRHVTRFGQKFSMVLVESVVNDVAVYERQGHVPGQDAAATGTKWSERDAAIAGFVIPKGKHYRR